MVCFTHHGIEHHRLRNSWPIWAQGHVDAMTMKLS
jgi:hypothetical protein